MLIVKKLLSVVMAIALVLTVVTVGVSAAGTASGDEYMTITVSTNENYMPDDIVTVTVNIKNNYNCTAFRFPVMFDSSVYEFPAVIGLTALGNCKAKGTIGANTSNDGSFIPTTYNASAWGCILVQWTANVANNEVGALNDEGGQAVFSFNLKVKSDALAGTAGTIFVPEEYDGFYYQAIGDVTDATTFYYLNSETLTRTFVPANPIILGDPIELVAREGSTTVIDETNKYVYALESPMSSTQVFNNYLELKGTNATLQYEGTLYGYGTGAKINVMLGTNKVTSYEVVIFGDSNGDSYADAYDLVDAINFVNLLSIPSDIQTFALDIISASGSATSGDGVVDAYDLVKLVSVANLMSSLDQANPYQS